MKTLKILRLFSLAVSLVLLLIGCLPRLSGEAGYDWMMLAVLVLFFVAAPVTLVSRIKSESSPFYLAQVKKGMTMVSLAAWACLICFAVYLMITGALGSESFNWIYLAFVFVGLYQILSSVILLKAKKAYEAENQMK